MSCLRMLADCCAVYCVRFWLSVISAGASLVADSKESARNAGDVGSIPGSGRPPGGRKGSPLQYSCPQNSVDRGASWLQSAGSQSLRRTEWLMLSPFSYNRAFCGDRDQASGVNLSVTTLVAQTVKNLQCRKPGLIPGLGRARGEGNGYLPQYPCLENSMDRGVWQATVRGVAKSWDMTEWLTLEEWVANSDAYLEIENWSVATIKFPSCKPLYNVDENCSEFVMNSHHQMLKSKKCTVPVITQVKLFLLWSTSAGKPCWCWVLSWVIMCSLWPKA